MSPPLLLLAGVPWRAGTRRVLVRRLLPCLVALCIATTLAIAIVFVPRRAAPPRFAIALADGGGAAATASLADTFNRSAGACGDRFGMHALIGWDNTKRAFAESPASRRPRLVCRSTNLIDQPPATRPHMICDADRLVVDRARIRPAYCPAARPGYRCDSNTFHAYAPGAFVLDDCTRDRRRFSDARFPADHLRDIFASVTCRPEPPPARHDALRLSGTTLLVTREYGEHRNLFHAMTDWINAFLVVVMLRVPIEQASVILLDNHDRSSLDVVWDAAFSRGRPTARLESFDSTTLLLDRAVFIPPGYSNFLYKNMEGDLLCDPPDQGVDVFAAFSKHILSSFGFVRRDLTTASANEPTRVTLIVRRPYENHEFVGRQLANEDELIGALNSTADVSMTIVDLALMPFREQLRVIHQSDIIVGMHGAGLGHAAWLPVHGGLLEIKPQFNMGWRCYDHLAQLVGVQYRQWGNRNYPKGWTKDDSGDYTFVNVDEIKTILQQMVQKVRQTKQEVRDEKI